MAKLFKDELLKDFSYTGKKGKQKFSNLATCSVIFGKIYYDYIHIYIYNINIDFIIQ